MSSLSLRCRASAWRRAQAGLAKEGTATMGWYQSEGGGFVFNAGSTDWVLGLADPAVERITRNVLDAARK